MPFTEKQRKLFHAAEEDPAVARERGMSGHEAKKLAGEADKLKSEDREKPPVKKAADPVAQGAADGTLYDLRPIFGQMFRR